MLEFEIYLLNCYVIQMKELAPDSVIASVWALIPVY